MLQTRGGSRLEQEVPPPSPGTDPVVVRAELKAAFKGPTTETAGSRWEGKLRQAGILRTENGDVYAMCLRE